MPQIRGSDGSIRLFSGRFLASNAEPTTKTTTVNWNGARPGVVVVFSEILTEVFTSKIGNIWRSLHEPMLICRLAWNTEWQNKYSAWTWKSFGGSQRQALLVIAASVGELPSYQFQEKCWPRSSWSEYQTQWTIKFYLISVHTAYDYIPWNKVC